MSDPGPTDALAAEYVLGTLDSDERTQAQALLVIDQEFVAKVQVWERRLGELHLMVEPVEPEGKLWERIKAKMPAVQPKPEIKLPEPTVGEPAPLTAAAAAVSVPASTDAAPAAKLPPATTLDVANASDVAKTSDVAQALDVARSAPSELASTLVAPAPKPSVVPPPVPAAAPVLTPGVSRVPGALRAPPVESKDDHTVRIRRRLTRWRALATLMMLVVVVAAALLAAWRFAPDRVPPMLQPVELMRFVGVTISALPPRKPAPPESQFDE